MFRITRYIILFIIIMMCLFWLQKNNVNVRAGLDTIINNTKSLFDDIRKSPKVDESMILKDLKVQDFSGGLSDNTQKATTIKSFIQDNSNTNDSVYNTSSKISIDGIIYYTNLERKKAGLSPLIKNNKLNISASKKVDDMFANQYFDHNSPKGDTAADIAKSINYKFQIIGENLALGIFDTDKILVKAWMDSPTHRANILNPKYTEIGAAVGISDYKGQKQWMAVQHFGKPMPICAEVDENTQKKIDTERTSLESEERELQKMAGVIETTSPESLERNYISNYNERVNNYNQRLNNLRKVIEDFNKTIVDYNNCLNKN